MALALSFMVLRQLSFTHYNLYKTRIVLPHYDRFSAHSPLIHLHWLPVSKQIYFKIAMLTYNILTTQ